MDMEFLHGLEEDFAVWNAIDQPLAGAILRGLFQYLRFVCDYSVYHERIYAMILGIFQNLILDTGSAAWEILHQFIQDETLSVCGRNNAVWIILGLIGHLLGHPLHQELVNDSIYMLFKNMTTGVQLDQVSLNISYYEHLEVDSVVKPPGIGLFALLGVHMPFLWPICCRQLQRLMDEEGGLLKAIKLLIGLFDYRHSGGFIKQRTQECDELVANILDRAERNVMLNIDPYVNWIQEAHIRDNKEGQTNF